MLSMERLRKDTKLLPSIVHFNNAGGSLTTREVTQAMVAYLEREGQFGAYETATYYAEQLQGFYHELATYLNCRPNQIAYAVSATDAFNRGLSSIDWKYDDFVLTTKSDYVSNHLLFIQLRKRFGVQTEILPEGKSGFDPGALARRLKRGPRPRLVSITHVPTNSGRVQDIAAAGKLCRGYGILFAVDACQSAGQLPLDVHSIQCDFLSATFRKYMRGPRGVGFLYVSDRVLDLGIAPIGMDLQGGIWTRPDQFQLQPDARRFELWERNMAMMLGAAKATAYLNRVGIDFIQERIRHLSRALETSVYGMAALQPHRYFEVSPSGIHLFSVPTWRKDPRTLIKILRENGLHASTSGQANDQYHFREKGIDWALRLSLHYYNTEEEIDRAKEILLRVLG
ncbi:MAG: aminotransferase class V-fold PLP-dependent enzyme [Bacteroidota bacterium]